MHWIRIHIDYDYPMSILDKPRLQFDDWCALLVHFHSKWKHFHSMVPSVDAQKSFFQQSGLKVIFGRTLTVWQNSLNYSGDRLVMSGIFQRDSTRWLLGDIYKTEVLTGHSALDDHQSDLFRVNNECCCRLGNSTVRHCNYFCFLWKYFRENNSARDFHIQNAISWLLH